MDINKIAIKGTTQDHLEIEDISDDLVISKDGSCSMILKTSSVNFDLLSVREQEAMIYAYAAMINSLTFPIQILIRSSLKDVSSYIKRLKEQEVKTGDNLLKKQISSYRHFVEEVVKKNNVLTKSFYIVIPFYSTELGVQAAAKSGLNILSFLSKSEKKLPAPKSEIISKAKAALEPKKEHLIRLFGRLGLSVKQLTTKELIQLFYRIYNQSSIFNNDPNQELKPGLFIRSKLRKKGEVQKKNQNA